MSAETPRRSRSASGTTTSGPTVASPQHVTDRGIIDSVAGFINEVVPTAYSTPVDTKDQIQWLHFEYIDKTQAENIDGINCGNGIPPPLIAVLGYGTGIQVKLKKLYSLLVVTLIIYYRFGLYQRMVMRLRYYRGVTVKFVFFGY